MSRVGLAQNFWEPAGGLYAHNIAAIAAGKDGSVFVASTAGYISKSDGKSAWTPCQVGALLGNQAFDKLNAFSDGTILIGMRGDGFNASGAISFDNGNTWRKASQTYIDSSLQHKTPFVEGDAIFTSDGKMFAAANVLTGLVDYYVMMSPDSGSSWVPATGNLKSSVAALVMTHNGDLLVGTGSGGGAYRSSDRGNSWSASGMNGYDMVDIAVAPNGHIFATADLGKTEETIFRSNDNGMSWSPISSILPKNKAYYTIAIDSSGILYTTGRAGIYRSTNEGNSWDFSNTGLPDSSQGALAVASDGTVYFSTYANGIYRSTDHGNSWKPFSTGLQNESVSVMIVDSSQNLFAGTGEGLYVSHDNGDVWRNVSMTGIDGIVSLAAAADGSVYVVNGTYPRLYRCGSDGHLIGNITPFQIEGTDQAHAIAVKADNTLFFSTSRGLFVSSNSGMSWSVPSPLIFDRMGIGPNGTIFGSGYGSSYAFSTDNGTTWSAKDTSTNGYGETSCIAFDYRGDVFAIQPSGLLERSTNNGLTWELINQPLPGLAHSLVANRINVLFASTDSGVFRSYTNGDSWQPVNSGLRSKTFGVLTVKSDGTLFIATEIGMFRSSHSTLHVGSDAKRTVEASLEQNFPNPFVTSTIIPFSLPDAEDISIELLDATGQSLATIAEGRFESGPHTIIFEANGLANGVYFYRMVSRESVQTRVLLFAP